ncbi:MAG: DUF4440 domain-containing protein [Acidimicrobiia bacterium]
MTGSASGLAYAAEVERLHAFFADWFADRGRRSIEEFSSALDPAFYLVSTDGDRMSREAIVEFMDSARGTGDVAIKIVNPMIHSDDGEIVVGTYEEHQVKRGVASERISTAVMRREEGAPGGWLWIAVHETWTKPPA